MRIALLIAASALLAGCSGGTDGAAGPSSSSATTQAPSGSTSIRTSAPAPAGTPTGATSPPATGAAIADVVAWVEAGERVPETSFHSATRDGVVTDLGADVAFVAGDANCMTDVRFGGALACLVDLAAPPPQPAEVYGQWKGGWVDFEGTSAEVGSAHGDPGRFSNGTGPELAAGQTLAFGDYTCRADATGVYCLNYAHLSALRFAGAGIEAFGCLQKVAPPADVGVKFSC